MRRGLIRLYSLCLIGLFAFLGPAYADSVSDNPILFVTAIPNPRDFGTLAATFSNHVPNPESVFRGGDLWIRYPDGSLKNLTESAGFGNAGMQAAQSIAVRDPAVHWDGQKAIFSMLVGAPLKQYQIQTYRWQLYEITGLGSSDTPVISKVANQPNYNNIAPAYASDDTIIFVSDRPRDDSVLHTYPQKDEYESAASNSGIWRLNPGTGQLKLLDHSPSGDFNPIIDSFGRIIFTRWDHLQRDQQNVGVNLGAFNFAAEDSTASTGGAPEVFPEPRSVVDPDYVSNINLHTLNQFFPWMMNQDGTDLETLNHIGRQEVGLYSERSFNDDPNVQEFYGQYNTGANKNDFTIFLHIKENPLSPGEYLGTSCQEFGTHSAGQIISISGAPSLNAEDMQVSYLTHPDTAGASNSPGPNHSGLYRDPLPLSNGKILVSHTSETREDTNIGSSGSPLSRYAFRLKLLTAGGSYQTASSPITPGISKSVSFWSPDILISYSGELWELMPVEVRARQRPQAGTIELPQPEKSVLEEMGVNKSELEAYLKSNNLALIISRNVTARDKNDRQQPVNLRVTDTNTASIPKSGKVYDLSHFQIFQGDLIRGYGTSSGRRVLAQPLHTVPDGLNMKASGGPAGSVEIAEDGSTAAFVPAGRALSWQTTGPDGKAVVRERYWLTFQPGEIRVCASCHGINKSDHLGKASPVNQPLALARLLANWKNLPLPTPKPTEVPSKNYRLKIHGETKPGKRFRLTLSGADSRRRFTLHAKIKKANCDAKEFPAGEQSSLKGKFPKNLRGSIKFSVKMDGAGEDLISKKVKLKGKTTRKKSPAAKSCKALIKSLKAS